MFGFCVEIDVAEGREFLHTAVGVSEALDGLATVLVPVEGVAGGFAWGREVFVRGLGDGLVEHWDGGKEGGNVWDRVPPFPGPEEKVG